MNKKSIVLLLVCLIFLCLGPVVFADGEIEIVGETNTKTGESYEYNLSNLNVQASDIIWYVEDNIQGVSIENLDQNKKARIYIANDVNVESFELVVKIKFQKEKSSNIQEQENDMNKIVTVDNIEEEKVVSKIIQIDQKGHVKDNNYKLKDIKSEDGIVITDTFKDEKLAEYIITYYDLDSDGKLSQEEIDKVKSLNLSDAGILSLDGIECLNKLISLTLTGAQIMHLDVSMFHQLTSLTCNRVPLTSLVIHNNSIEVLKVNNSLLTTLDFRSSEKLRSIDCSQNSKLSSLLFSNQNAITSLNCKQTAITSLDLRQLSILNELDCGNNALASLDLSHNPLIQYVTVSNCERLASIDVTKCPELLWLYAGTNALTELDVTQNPKLSILNIPSNSIRTIDLTRNVELRNLNVMQNKLSDIDVSHNTKLTQYSSLGNQQIDIQFQYNKKLQKWISQSIPFLDNKVFSGSMFTSSHNPITYDESSQCFVADKAEYFGSGSMQSTFTLPGNGTTAKLNAIIHFEFICQIEYKTAGGTPQPESHQSHFGDILQEPIQPTKLGYLFKGWYEDEAETQLWDFENDAVDGDLTLYAKWEVQKYTVHFHNSYDINIPPQTIEYQGKVKEPSAKPIKNYQFMGWYTDSQYQNLWDFSTDQVNADIDLYAYYKEVVAHPESNILSNSQINQGSQIVLTCATPNAKIYYTIDGQKPTIQSQLYTKPITVNHNIVMTAIAVKEGCIDSDVVTYRYTVMKAGNIDIIIKVEGQGNITVGKQQDILSAVLNAEDYLQHQKGNDIVITLECQLIEGCEEPIDKNLIKGYHVGTYLDISVFKQIGKQAKEKVTELNQPIQLTIDVPNELLPDNNTHRIYSVLRIHNGENTILNDRDQELGTITIESHKFSTYIILYQDKIPAAYIQNETAKTNDKTKYLGYCVLFTVSLTVILIKKHKRI